MRRRRQTNSVAAAAAAAASSLRLERYSITLHQRHRKQQWTWPAGLRVLPLTKWAYIRWIRGRPAVVGSQRGSVEARPSPRLASPCVPSSANRQAASPTTPNLREAKLSGKRKLPDREQPATLDWRWGLEPPAEAAVLLPPLVPGPSNTGDVAFLRRSAHVNIAAQHAWFSAFHGTGLCVFSASCVSVLVRFNCTVHKGVCKLQTLLFQHDFFF